MTVELTPEQVDIFKKLLEREIAETGPEIRHTQTSSYHDELKAYKRELQTLHEWLSALDAG